MTQEHPVAGREIADLLPFYATGRLNEGDRRRVMNALVSDPALQHELELIIDERDAAVDVNEALGLPSRNASTKFFAALEAATPPKPARFDLAAWIASRLEGLAPRHVAFGAMAAGLVVVAQAGLIGSLLSGHHTQAPAFESASVNPGAGIHSGGSLLVAFVPSATVQQIGGFLEETSASIVAGPLPGGLYELRIGDRALTKSEMDELIARFKTQGTLVRFVAPAASPD